MKPMAYKWKFWQLLQSDNLTFVDRQTEKFNGQAPKQRHILGEKNDLDCCLHPNLFC